MSYLFLGVGNRERGDDAVGPRMAEAFAVDPSFSNAGITVVDHSGEGVSLMHLWEGKDRVVIVDAMKCGLRLGSMRRFDAIKSPLSYGVFRYSSHLFGLAEATEMARTLGTLPKEMIIFGIEGRAFGFGDPMSPSVVRAMKKVEIEVRKELGLKG